MTTFESNEQGGETIIKAKSKKVIAKEGLIIEEVLSDTEEEKPSEVTPSVEIVEINDTKGNGLLGFPLIFYLLLFSFMEKTKEIH